MDATDIAARQLGRMRAMNRFYHERFFSDVRITTLLIVALFVAGGWGVSVAYLLIPPVALLGAVQTAFDASYLVFSRHYATALEKRLNEAVGGNVLVAHQMEDSYLFPLNERKIVVAPLGSSFSWFGFMTLFYTVLGSLAFLFGLALGWGYLADSGTAWQLSYLISLGALVTASLATGIWWFVGGVGERRLRAITETIAWTSRPSEEDR